MKEIKLFFLEGENPIPKKNYRMKQKAKYKHPRKTHPGKMNIWEMEDKADLNYVNFETYNFLTDSHLLLAKQNQQRFPFSQPTKETLERGVKYNRSYQ